MKVAQNMGVIHANPVISGNSGVKKACRVTDPLFPPMINKTYHNNIFKMILCSSGNVKRIRQKVC